MNWLAYIGTYTRKLPYVDGHGEGIYRLMLDGGSGRFGALELAAQADNPAYLALGSNRRLYAALELDEMNGQPGGGVAGYAIAGGGELRLLAQVSSRGAGPCHVAADPAGRFVLAANYTAGSLARVRLGADGAPLAGAQVMQHDGLGPDVLRQAGPHVHSAAVTPDERWVLAADLGIDQVVIYRLGRAGRLLPAGSLALPAGSGPRHFALHPNGRWLYVLNELHSTLTFCLWDGGAGQAKIVETISLLAPGFGGANTGAQVLVHPGGQFVYASNRGEDSLAWFAVQADGRLQAAGRTASGGHTPRHFRISPDGRWLVAANQDSDELALFAWQEDGRLELADRAAVPSPACVILVAPGGGV